MADKDGGTSPHTLGETAGQSTTDSSDERTGAPSSSDDSVDAGEASTARGASDGAFEGRALPRPRPLPIVDPAHYEVGREFSQGGTGRLLSARDRRLGRTVAIKQLRFRGAHIEARFRREAEITARLEHPAIV